MSAVSGSIGTTMNVTRVPAPPVMQTHPLRVGRAAANTDGHRIRNRPHTNDRQDFSPDSIVRTCEVCQVHQIKMVFYYIFIPGAVDAKRRPPLVKVSVTCPLCPPPLQFTYIQARSRKTISAVAQR